MSKCLVCKHWYCPYPIKDKEIAKGRYGIEIE